MEFVPCADAENASEQAARALEEAVRGTAPDPALLLFAGGSWLEVLELVDPQEWGKRLTLMPSDERYSQDPSVSNFSLFVKTGFYKRVLGFGCGIINTTVGEEESLEAFTNRFETGIRDWMQANPQGKLVLAEGIGPDGHTCGIMPYPEAPEVFEVLFEDPEEWVSGYDATGKNQYPLRVTVTMPLLRKVDASVVYAVGAGKSEALRRVGAVSGTLAETPARIVREMKNVKLYTDISI